MENACFDYFVKINVNIIWGLGRWLILKLSAVQTWSPELGAPKPTAGVCCISIPSIASGGRRLLYPGTCWLAELAKLMKSIFNERPCLEKQAIKGEQLREIPNCDLWPPQGFIRVCVHKYVHIQPHEHVHTQHTQFFDFICFYWLWIVFLYYKIIYNIKYAKVRPYNKIRA